MCNTHYSICLEQEAADALRGLAPASPEHDLLGEETARAEARTTDDELLATAGEVRRDG